MLRLFSDQDAHTSRKQRLMRGALILVGLLFTLWLIVWLLPTSTPPPVRSDAAGTVAAPSSEEASPALQLLTPGRVVVVLLLGGGLGYALYLRRNSNDATPNAAPMQSLGHFPIAPDQQLKLVSCQDEVLLLGISPNEITLLRTYPRTAFDESASGDAPARAATSPASPEASFSGFADVLRQYTHNSRHA